MREGIKTATAYSPSDSVNVRRVKRLEDTARCQQLSKTHSLLHENVHNTTVCFLELKKLFFELGEPKLDHQE